MTQVRIAEAVESLLEHGLPVRFTAYDGSAAGPVDSPICLDLRSAKGLAQLLTAPGDLGMARAYLTGELVATGVHPADPYDLLMLVQSRMSFHRPSVAESLALVRDLGLHRLRPPSVPSFEAPARWRRNLGGVRHSLRRDASAISRHYDVSNKFYEMVLGPSMAYTCAVFGQESASLEEAQIEKFDLVARKLDLRPGQRLLDVGCGWGGMVQHAAREYGVRTIGVTLSRPQAEWGKRALDEAGLGDLAEIRHADYRDVLESDFDAVSSIGLTEHIGVRHYSAYFSFLRDRVIPGGRMLNHCVTRPTNEPTATGAFIDRYIFPDGELTGAGAVIVAAQDVGWEFLHGENLRPHYARTLAQWSANLRENWDACVAEVGIEKARGWGLYLAGSRVGFERNDVELHHALLVNTDPTSGEVAYGLRPDWGS